MSLQICTRCLARASISSSVTSAHTRLPRATAAPFSTSSALSANPPKKSVTPAGGKKNARPDRGQKLTFSKKGKKHVVADKGRRPAIGERKALRKRVVLSNTNALEVKQMEDFKESDMIDEEAVGRVVGIEGSLVDQLRIVQAFKPSQGWSLFRRPGMLIRRETVEYGKLMEHIAQEKQVIRRVLVGERASGKTVMLLQAMTMAMMKGWVVINIPDAMDLTIAQTEYSPVLGTDPLEYIQPTYTASLLLAISRANPVLQTLQLSQPQQSQSASPIPIPPNISLARLCLLGSEDPEIAWPIFQILLSELKAPGRPPLLMCLDGLAFAMRATKYIDGTHYKPIHAHSFTLISTFLAHLSGTAPLPNGGLVLAATSESNRPNVEALELALGQLEGKQEATRDPFKKYDEKVMGVFTDVGSGEGRGVEVQRVGGLGKGEARSLMEYWARSGMVKGVVGEREVAEKWSVAGGGVVGELERACVRMRV